MLLFIFQTYVCVAEFATPLSNLNMMWKRRDLYGFSKDRKEAEYNEFIDNLAQILECFPECNDKCILLEYNGVYYSLLLI